MSNVIRTTNPLKVWILESREMQRRDPNRFLASYPEIEFLDHRRVRMSKKTLDKIDSHCGRYDTSFPTGEYCGKMFLRGRYLCWYGISRQSPMKLIQLNFREIILSDV